MPTYLVLSSIPVDVDFYIFHEIIVNIFVYFRISDFLYPLTQVNSMVAFRLAYVHACSKNRSRETNHQTQKVSFQ